VANAGPRKRPALEALAVIALLAVSAISCTGREQPRAAVVIVVDALRANHLGLYGYKRPTSPNLDGWSREGRIFERAYSTSSWTLPSFASLYTGQLPIRHRAGMTRFDGPEAVAANRLDSAAPTIAEGFAARGFATGAAVNNPLLEPSFGLDRGFQVYDHPLNRGRAARRADEMVDRSLALTIPRPILLRVPLTAHAACRRPE
jgi:arylsulfatase A-like enzyme